MSLFDKVRDKSGIVVSAILKKGTKTVELFGEIHNDNENGFFEEILERNLLKDVCVLCEHATVLSHIRDVPFASSTKGSEYIFFNLENNEPICVDNRIEMGLLSAMEEKSLMNFFINQNFNIEYIKELKKLLLSLQPIIKRCIAINSLFSELYEEEFSNIIEAIVRQLNILILLSGRKDAVVFLNGTGDLKDDIQNGAIISRIGEFIIMNIRKIGSMLVDVNILRTIDDIQHDNIAVFVGAAHVVKLVRKIPDATYTIQPSAELVELCLAEPLGIKSDEIEFIQKLKQS